MIIALVSRLVHCVFLTSDERYLLRLFSQSSVIAKQREIEAQLLYFSFQCARIKWIIQPQMLSSHTQ